MNTKPRVVVLGSGFAGLEADGTELFRAYEVSTWGVCCLDRGVE